MEALELQGLAHRDLAKDLLVDLARKNRGAVQRAPGDGPQARGPGDRQKVPFNPSMICTPFPRVS